jgi:NAD+ kinase
VSKLAGILYHPRVPAAQVLAVQLAQVLEQRGYQTWRASAWAEEEVQHLMPGTDAVVSIGGDGTILRAARAIIPAPVPILGVRFGRLGFLAEIAPADALQQAPALLDNPGPLETRAMLKATCALTKVDPTLAQKHHPLMNGDPSFHALNDVVIARGAAGRPIYVEVTIDGQPCITYRADAVVMATATGSTGYTLSAGGPILHPQSRNFLLCPVAAHATLPNALLLEPESRVQLRVHSDHGAVMSIDGQVDITLADSDTVTVTLSPYQARFIRAQPGDAFYRTLLQRLHFGESIPG